MKKTILWLKDSLKITLLSKLTKASVEQVNPIVLAMIAAYPVDAQCHIIRYLLVVKLIDFLHSNFIADIWNIKKAIIFLDYELCNVFGNLCYILTEAGRQSIDGWKSADKFQSIKFKTSSFRSKQFIQGAWVVQNVME